VNITQIKSRERDNKARALELKQQLHAAQTKNFRGLEMKAMEVEVAAVQAEADRLKFYRERAEAIMSSKNYAALRDGGPRLAMVPRSLRTAGEPAGKLIHWPCPNRP
jgi:hypothetical protein